MKNQKTDTGLSGFGITLIISIVLILVQRSRWIAYLEENGFGAKDVFVPLHTWLPFHTTPTSVLLNMLILLPVIFLIVGAARKNRL